MKRVLIALSIVPVVGLFAAAGGALWGYVHFSGASRLAQDTDVVIARGASHPFASGHQHGFAVHLDGHAKPPGKRRTNIQPFKLTDIGRASHDAGLRVEHGR